MISAEANTISSPRAHRAATDLFARWFEPGPEGRAPLDRCVASYFRSHKELNSGERRWISAAVYGTVRLLRRQETLLAQLSREVTPEEFIRLWIDEHEAGEPVRQAVAALPLADNLEGYLRITQSLPDSMAEDLKLLLGEDAALAAVAFNAQAPTTLRVNPLRTRKSRVVDALPGCEPTLYSPWGLELPHRVNINDLAGFKEGWFEIQEEASQIAALLSNVQPGMTVVDVGAGAGGKTLALAAMIQSKGTIVALDYSETRLEELKERVKRAKAKDVLILKVSLDDTGLWVATGANRQNLNRLFGQADCVFVDAPCTGSGALRRNPDARWREHELRTMPEVQFQILEQSAALVCPGGSLLYVTCAFERRQNEEVIERFLLSQLGSQFELVDGKAELLAAIERAARETMGESAGAKWKPSDIDSLFTGPYLRTWPHRHGLDAFFGARLIRRGEAVA